MTGDFYKHFFNFQYDIACTGAKSSEIDIDHYKLASILAKPDFSYCDALKTEIDPIALELEALRLEASFGYSRALEIRYAISEYNNSIANQLAILDIQLKFKPIDECNLSLLNNLNLEQLEESVLSKKRLLNILGFISDNSGHIILSQPLVDLVKNLFQKQYKEKPSLVSAQNLIKAYYFLQEYDLALGILTEIKTDLLFNDEIADFFIKTNIKLCNFYEALEFSENYLAKYPFSIRINKTYGTIMRDFCKYYEGFRCFDKALKNLVAYKSIKVIAANSYYRFHSYRLATSLYYEVINIIPLYNQLCCHIACLSDDIDDVKHLCEQALVSIPNSSLGILTMGYLAVKLGKSELDTLKSARKMIPYSWNLASKILTLIRDNNLASQEDFDNLVLKEEICLQFANSNNLEYKLLANIALVSIYLYHGLLAQLCQILDIFQEMLIKSENLYVSAELAMAINSSLCFTITSIRDSVLFNSLIFSAISEKFRQMFSSWRLCVEKLYDIDFSTRKQKRDRPVRVGFLSPHFRGHVVSLLSIDVIREMSLIPDLEVMMIVTGEDCKESLFLKEAKEIPSLKVVELYDDLFRQLVAISDLNLDVLIDLDGITVLSSCVIIFCQPAIVNCSWLGFDAPYVSDKNYFLCDRYTHPEGVDEFYLEKLVRLPHSHMCVGGFKVSDKDISEARSELGISNDQIVFIYPSGVRKFNFDSAMAHAQILSRVPNSVLVVKKYSGTPRLVEIWKEEFAKVGVDPGRLKLAPNIPDPEQHRLLLKMSDVYLDAYPYNGGSISLEAVWCNLPIVTYCGEQSFARMGYSLLSTAGITEGIAHSWEEYIEWAVRLGTDRDLRLSIKERLAKGKDPDHLCPLWNPKQFARDMYNILQELYEQAEV
jgi:predicted O-linked N-acetylglucosamine transferase (SPINDLY family)